MNPPDGNTLVTAFVGLVLGVMGFYNIAKSRQASERADAAARAAKDAMATSAGNHAAITDLRVSVDGRLTQLLELQGQAKYFEGQAAGSEVERSRAMERHTTARTEGQEDRQAARDVAQGQRADIRTDLALPPHEIPPIPNDIPVVVAPVTVVQATPPEEKK